MSKRASSPESAAATVDLVCFDVTLKTGTLSVEAGPVEALQLTNWLYAMGWVNRDFRDCMYNGVRGVER